MVIKIVREIKLSEGQTALKLSKFPSAGWKHDFDKWAKDCEISQYVKIENFYTSEMFGDVDYPAIQIKKYAPHKIKTLCILRWS